MDLLSVVFFARYKNRRDISLYDRHGDVCLWHVDAHGHVLG